MAGHKEASPFLAKIPVRTQKEGSKHRVGEEDSDYQLCSVETRLDIRDAEGLSVSEFYERAGKLGAEMAEIQSKRMFQKMSAVPTPSHMAPLDIQSFGDLLATWEKMEINFDARGVPKWPSIVVAPEEVQRITDLMDAACADPDQRRQWAELVVNKRREHHERETRRRLVD